MMNKLFAGRITSRKRFAGKSDFSAKQVSTTLLLLLLCLLMPQGTNAREIEYDFEALATNAHYQFNNTGTYTINHGSGYSGVSFTVSYQASTSFNSYTVDLSRFAFRSNNNEDGKGIKGWILQYDGDASPNKGLVYRGTEEHFIICDLRPEDEVTIYYHTTTGNNRTATLFFESGSASINGTNLSNGDVVCSSSSTSSQTATFKATSRGDVILYTTKANAWQTIISKIVINRPDVASYAYDPAKEVYDLTKQTNGSASISNKSAGYSLDNGTAYYIVNSGYELNNRVAIKSASDLSWNSGLQYNGNSYSMLSISNLNAADRVKITLSGNVIFANEGSVANGNVFLDASNDGEQDATDDVTVAGGNSVGSETWYTMLEDGHIDLVLLSGGAKITKIEIYSDHKATYIDTDNGDGSHTLTFDGTGQLVEKTAYIPGLRMEFGDASKEAEHFFVTLSDAGPVSWGYDHKKFLMARRSDNQTNLSKAPVTGTFYKFIPEISGTLNIDFKALSVKYGNALTNNDPSNEEITGASCPYVFIKVDANGSVTDMTPSNHNFGNGNLKRNYNNGFSLEKGYTYYFYGWWPGYENNNTEITGSCGVAKLLSAKYTPSFMMPELACVTTNGATSFDGSTSEPKIRITGAPGNLSLSVKKASENINTSNVRITLDNSGYLQITGIGYNDESKDKAGVILVKATANEGEHVFALTIPYSAAFNNGEGHTWDFFSQPLEIGNYFSDFYGNTKVQAKQKLTESDIAGMEKNTNSQLYREIEKADGTDWTFTYRQVGSNGTVKDPMFQNVYDMEGDNADMIWETEGLWFDTPSNKSAILNERLGVANHSSSTDPDRYVAILPDADGNSSFTIPGLKKDDRVRIYMGSGDGSSTDACFLKISNARDAVYKEILENDIYKAGGSYWDLSGKSYDYYACYHFFAKEDGPITFRMVGGSMCKIYRIEIYRGARRKSNGVLGTRQYYHSKGDGASGQMYMNLHHRGKGETLANGTTVSNEMIAKSGNITTNNITLSTNGNDLIWSVAEGTFGVARMRLKCMEYNQNYVTDFADFNVTVGYKQKVDSYPYTWDFTDIPLKGGKGSGEDVTAENTKYPDTEKSENIEDKGWDLSMWDANGAMVLRNPDYPNDNANEIFAQNKNGKGNQLYANGKIIPETLGLWFYMDNNDAAYNGSMKIAADGLHLACTKDDVRRGWWNYKMVVPAVPAGAAVYLRVARDNDVKESDVDSQGNKFFHKKYRFDHMPVGHYSDSEKAVDIKFEIGEATTEYDGIVSDFTYDETYNQYSKYYPANDNSGDYIIAIYNWGAESDLTLTLNGFVLKKLAVSTDFKTVNRLGWATESRARVIDPALTSEMTGYPFETYIVTGASYANKTVTLSPVSVGDFVMPIASDGDNNAYIIRNTLLDNTKVVNGVKEPGRVQILNNGFHLFVPDMHDYQAANDVEGNTLNQKKKNEMGSNMLVSLLTSQTLNKQGDGNVYNYALTSQKNKVGDDTQTYLDEIGFYRIKDGTKSSGNQGYLPVDCTVPTGTTDGGGAKMSIIFDSFDDPVETVETAIEVPFEKVFGGSEPVYYNLNGQKLSGKPTQGGLYIVNGKKVLVK